MKIKLSWLLQQILTSPISKFLSNNREGMHHIAFAVDNIQAEMERLKSEGITIVE